MITKGKATPISGVLLERKTLLEILKTLERRAKESRVLYEVCEKNCVDRLEAARSDGDTLVNMERERTASCQRDRNRIERIYRNALQRCPKSVSSWKWYLVSGISAAAGAGICALSTAATK